MSFFHLIQRCERWLGVEDFLVLDKADRRICPLYNPQFFLVVLEYVARVTSRKYAYTKNDGRGRIAGVSCGLNNYGYIRGGKGIMCLLFTALGLRYVINVIPVNYRSRLNTNETLGL